jgi:hypothetical protein
VSIKVTVSGARRGLFGPYRFKTIAAVWAAEVGPLVQGALKRTAPVAKTGAGAGRLKASIRRDQVNGPGGVTLTFFTDGPYAKYVLEGTSPHEIWPRNKQALFWEGAAHPVGMVNHPGTKPSDFPRRAITPLLPTIQRRFKEITVEAMGGQP